MRSLMVCVCLIVDSGALHAHIDSELYAEWAPILPLRFLVCR